MMEKCAKITAFLSREIQGCFAESTLTMCNFVFKHADLVAIPVACYLLFSEAKPCYQKTRWSKYSRSRCITATPTPWFRQKFFAHLFGRHPIHASCADFLVAFFLHFQKSFGSYKKWKDTGNGSSVGYSYSWNVHNYPTHISRKCCFPSSRGTPCDKNNTHNVA